MIEVILDDEEPDGHETSTGDDSGQEEPPPQLELDDFGAKETPQSTVASLSRVPRLHPFRLRGVLKGQCMVCLVDSGAMHNFIDEGLVVKCGLQVEEFYRYLM